MLETRTLIGSNISHYRVIARLGAGGMGEVYRATDTKLRREVALKVLPQSVATDPQRMARFEREAQLLAALNHPNIAAIYGLEDSDSTRALVIELVEGPTLAERITQGAIPFDEAIDIGRQIAEALEYAHERGIVHRDLKPANVKITPEGVVKVLDFGLAKARTSEASATNTEESTITVGSTRVGVVVGTAAYMSPEQACGKPVDKRADIWAFGCVLFEILTECRPFTGQTSTEIIAAILEREPDWGKLPATTPQPLRRLLLRCLEKDPKCRLRDAGDACLELEE